MGTWALSDFRDRVARVFSSRGIDNPRYTEWVNMAKREVESSQQFEAMKKRSYITTVSGQREYSTIADHLSIVSIVDRTSERALIRTDIENLELRDRDATGKPKYWAIVGDELIFSPIPDGAYEIEATVITEPADLSADADTTLLPSYWDNAIYFLAVHYGWLELGDDQKAQLWFERYIGYVRTRMADEDWEGTSMSEPVRVVSKVGDLRRRR